MKDIEPSGKLLQMLIKRLERISVDSYWAHRASGIRGTLIRLAEQIEAHQTVEQEELEKIVQLGFFILEISAREKRPARRAWRK
jgi:hypothetical protein